MSRPIRRNLTALAVAAVLLAGCSSDGSEGSENDPSASSTTVAAPVTAAVPPFDPAAATAEAYTDALIIGLGAGSADQGQIVVTEAQAECIAPRWIEAIGLDALVAAEVAPEALADPGFRFGPLGIDAARAERMLAAYDPCGADVWGLFALALTAGQPMGLQTCAVASLDQDLARKALVAALTGSASLEDDLAALGRQLSTACTADD